MNKRKFLSLLAAVGLALAGAETVLGHVNDPATERGFKPDAVYSFNGLDNVNAFNGGLILSIPLGPRYPLGGGLEFGLTLAYSSSLWEFDYRECGPELGDPRWHAVDREREWGEFGCVTQALPARANAGMGWRLELGAIRAPFVGTDEPEEPWWEYWGPDGSRSGLFQDLHAGSPDGDETLWYTRDGSYRRFRQTATGWLLEMPDGQVHTFEQVGDDYLLRRIEDPFGNGVEVDYSDPDAWEIHDLDTANPRTWRIELVNGKVDRVLLPAFGGATAIYQFSYGTGNAFPGCPHNQLSTAVLGPYPLLTGIDLPVAGERFDFSYFTNAEEPYAGRQCSDWALRMKSVTLPTQGSIHYTWGPIQLPRFKACENLGSGQHFDRAPDPDRIGNVAFSWGVGSRTLKDRDGAVIGAWEYRGPRMRSWNGNGLDPSEPTPFFPNPRPLDATWTVCNLPTSAYADVFEPIDSTRRRRSRQWFSVFTQSLDPQDVAEGWRTTEYGLPLNRSVVAPFDLDANGNPLANARYLSTAVYECDQPASQNPPAGYDWDGCRIEPLRATFVRYEDSGFACDQATVIVGEPGPRWAENEPKCLENNRRQVSSITYFYDDDAARPEGTGEIFVRSESSDFDGFGHYRTTRSSSNFVRDDVIEGDPPFYQTTRFNPTQVFGTHGNQLDLPSALEPWLLNLYTEQTVTLSGSLGGTSIERFDFNSSTGFLQEKRSLRGPALGAADLLVRFTADARGNVARESFYGGLAGAGVEQYRTLHSYSWGIRKKTERVDPATGRVIQRDLDLTIDSSTGMPSASYDSAGVGVQLSYDLLSRLKSEVPTHAGEAGSFYTYVPATSSAGAYVLAERKLSAGSAALTREEHHYDGQGRVVRQLRSLPAGQTAERCSVLSPQNWLTQVSTWHTPNGCGSGLTWEATTTYDLFGRATKVVGADGARTETDYDGIRASLVTTFGIATPSGVGSSAFKRLSYDHRGNLTVVTEPSRPEAVNPNPTCQVGTGNYCEATWSYFYDQGNRLVKARSRNQPTVDEYQERLFSYDGAGILLSEQHPEMVTVDTNGTTPYRWTYTGHDASGNPAAKLLDPGPGTKFSLSYRYDKAGRVTQIRSYRANPANEKLLKELFYAPPAIDHEPEDGSGGKLVLTKRHHLELTPTGDQSKEIVVEEFRFGGVGGRLSEASVRSGGVGEVPRVVFTGDYSYDSLGNVLGTHYPICDFARCAATPDRTVNNVYDQGLLVGVTGYAPLIRYHRNGLIQEIRHQNQVSDLIDIANGLPRPAQMHTLGVVAGPDWDSGSYVYDGAGNISSIGPDVFRYDRVNRLVSASMVWNGNSVTQGYHFDHFGNMTAIDQPGNSRSFTVDWRNNRLVGSLAYDFAGNAVPNGWSYNFDAFNLVNELSGSGVTRSFLYTASDERVATLFDTATAGSVAERWSLRSAGNAVLRDYEHLTDGSWRWASDYVHRDTQLLAEVRPSTAGPEQVLHQHLDHLGTPRLVTDAAGHRVVEHKYLPFGEQLSAPNTGDTRLKFTGHERDDLDPNGQLGDLDYMHARYYSPLWFRFLSVDPMLGKVELPQSWNRYLYVNNSPVVQGDPDGEAAQVLVGAGIGAAWKGGLEIFRQVSSGEKLNWRKIAVETGRGALEGAVAGLTGGASLGWRMAGSIAADVGGGMLARGLDGDDSTQATDLHEVAIDAAFAVFSAAGSEAGQALRTKEVATSGVQRMAEKQAERQVRATAQRSASRQAVATANAAAVAARPAVAGARFGQFVDKTFDVVELLAREDEKQVPKQ